MGVEFSCPTLILLPVAALPAPWNGSDSAAAALDGRADSNGAATPAAASLRVSRRLRGVFIEQPPGQEPWSWMQRRSSSRVLGLSGFPVASSGIAFAAAELVDGSIPRQVTCTR